jgi:SAM-dependent methyltransferase
VADSGRQHRQTIPRCCPLCSACDFEVYHDQGYRQVVRCCKCRFVSTHPLPTPERKRQIEHEAYHGELLPEAADFFRNCHRDFLDDPVIRSFRDALDWIDQHCAPGRLLDVGSGTGIFLHLASEKGWKPLGIDICAESAEKAATEFDLRVDVGDFQVSAYEPASFDAVTMLDVLEHTVDPIGFLRRAFEVLRPGGILYVAVPNQRCLITVLLDRWIRAGGPMREFFLAHLYVIPHVHYFCPITLRRSIENVGFQTTGLRGGNVYLGRYRVPLAMRLPMEIVLQAGNLVGMSAKIHAIARKPY